MNHKKTLNSVLASLSDNTFKEAKFHIRRAIRKIEEVEKKLEKKAEAPPTQHQTWNELLQGNLVNPLTPQRTLDIINKMIEEENNKFKSKEPEIDNETLFG